MNKIPNFKKENNKWISFNYLKDLNPMFLLKYKTTSSSLKIPRM